jgi:hypothetical protein
MSRLLTIPVMPNPKATRVKRTSNKRFVDGQKMIVEAIRYLAQNPAANRDAVSLLSEHFRTQFRMSDRGF